MSTFKPVPKPSPRPKRRPNPGHPYLAWLKGQACCACGATAPSEAAHVEGPMSLKTGQVLPRRLDEAYLSAVPLCTKCHRIGRDSVHERSEPYFSDDHWRDPDALARLAHTYLAAWILEGRP